MEKSKKLIELDAASVIFMLLVIFIHVSAECVTKFNTDSIQFVLICSAHRLSSFVVQGFIFLSGLKLFLPRHGNFSYSRFYLSRIKRVVLPYICVFSVFTVYFIITKRIATDPIYILKSLLTGSMVGHFYFVAIICQFYLLIPLWRFIAKRCSPILSVFVSLIIMLICNSFLPEIIITAFGAELTMNSHLFTSYLFYFVCGIFAGQYYEAFCGFIRKRTCELAILFASLGSIDCLLILVIRKGLYYPSWADYFHAAYCTIAVLFTMSVVLLFKDNNALSEEIVSRLSAISYYVYLIHPLFIFICESLLSGFGIASLSLRFLVKFIFTYSFSIVPLLLIFYFAKKYLDKPRA